MASLVLTIKSEETQSLLQQLLQLSSTKDREAALALSRLFKDCANHRSRAVIDIQTGSAAPVAASATFTLDTVVATDAVTVGTITFTGTDTPTTALHFDTDAGSDTLIAESLADAINAHSTLSQQVVATSAAAVVTVTALQKGVCGNAINFSSADATITASAAHLEGGTGGATEAGSTFYLGLS